MGPVSKHIPPPYPLLCLLFFCVFNINTVSAQAKGNADTTKVGAVVYDGDTIPARTLYEVAVYGRLSGAALSASEKWTRLRNAVYVTYPYARRAGAVINDMNKALATINDDSK